MLWRPWRSRRRGIWAVKEEEEAGGCLRVSGVTATSMFCFYLPHRRRRRHTYRHRQTQALEKDQDKSQNLSPKPQTANIQGRMCTLELPHTLFLYPRTQSPIPNLHVLCMSMSMSMCVCMCVYFSSPSVCLSVFACVFVCTYAGKKLAGTSSKDAFDYCRVSHG